MKVTLYLEKYKGSKARYEGYYKSPETNLYYDIAMEVQVRLLAEHYIPHLIEVEISQ